MIRRGFPPSAFGTSQGLRVLQLHGLSGQLDQLRSPQRRLLGTRPSMRIRDLFVEGALVAIDGRFRHLPVDNLGAFSETILGVVERAAGTDGRPLAFQHILPEPYQAREYVECFPFDEPLRVETINTRDLTLTVSDHSGGGCDLRLTILTYPDLFRL